MFEDILNWKLLAGSHKFPGPDGGTCINEAAIIAAGFEYRRVHSIASCPPCFSRPIGAYALGLNDAPMSEKVRQELLMPFVTRLAGTADSDEIEVLRARIIVRRTVKEILPLVVQGEALDFIKNSIAFGIQDEIPMAPSGLYGTVPDDVVRFWITARMLRFIVGAGSLKNKHNIVRGAAEGAASILSLACLLSIASYQIIKIGVSILDDALKLGKQADPIEVALVRERMDQAKGLVAA